MTFSLVCIFDFISSNNQLTFERVEDEALKVECFEASFVLVCLVEILPELHCMLQNPASI
jgi:hypothetical protein